MDGSREIPVERSAAAPPNAGSSRKYAIWNNKGGVGKTFVTFAVAAEYARRNPERTVVVVDMCPQANVSEIVLGGNGAGSKQLQRLLTAPTPRPTVGGYFDSRLLSPHTPTGQEASYLVDAAAINHNLPPNVRLIAGDPSLEIQAQAMNQISGQLLPATSWASVHKWLIDLLGGVSNRFPDSDYFIDTNPSFGTYTELALLAAERLIVPCSADGSSARAIDNLGRLLYGVGVPMAYKAVNFSSRASSNGLGLPSVHLVPLNRSTQYYGQPSRSFAAMYGEIQARVGALETATPANFSRHGSKLFFDIPDAHTVSIVVSHEGMPLDRLRVGNHDVNGQDIMVNQIPLDRYRQAVEQLVNLL